MLYSLSRHILYGFWLGTESAIQRSTAGCPTQSRFSNEWDSEITGRGVFHHRPHI